MFTVSAVHKETKQFFTLYNTLDDKKVYLEKEVRAFIERKQSDVRLPVLLTPGSSDELGVWDAFHLSGRSARCVPAAGIQSQSAGCPGAHTTRAEGRLADSGLMLRGRNAAMKRNSGGWSAACGGGPGVGETLL